ncbi:thioredoxin family protein [[Mycoplasma] anseris]|uniref:Thioredoxin n=1 Tax=[Mycoplasma] anseris TaxID=92400 RepID=A0A2Z4NCX3_9BACT|nr:thioredoxin family protein [[Mycoplasma] anseris]AWX69399.1 thioredoxin [[Mycoplasma] anseris]
MITKTNKKDLDKKYLEGKAILAFRATWCPPCQMMGPELQRLADEHADINVYDIDVDENIEFAREMKVNGIPSLFLYENGNFIENVTGYLPAEELLKKFNK